MTRVTESQLARASLQHISRAREAVQKYSNQVDTGLKVEAPGDSDQAAVIAQYNATIAKIEGYRNRTAEVRSFLTFQDDALAQVNDLIIRGKEIAEQAANESNSATARAQLAEEVFQIRDHLVSIANTRYQGRYVWGGADDDDPPYDAASYTLPASGNASVRYVFDAEDGTDLFPSVAVADDVSITTKSAGDDIFDRAIAGMEWLGRSLAGYKTTFTSGLPDGGGVAYTSSEFSTQSADIRSAMDLLETARSSDVEPERVTIGGKLRRIETAESLLEVAKVSAEQVLDRLQNADILESSSKLQQAQTLLQASLLVSSKVLNQDIGSLLG